MLVLCYYFFDLHFSLFVSADFVYFVRRFCYYFAVAYDSSRMKIIELQKEEVFDMVLGILLK